MTITVIASSYPLLDVFWTMLWFFLFFIWIWLLITVFIDLFRSHDLSGWGKAGWTIFIIILPLLGVLFYLIFRGNSMRDRQQQDAARQEQAFRQYVQQAATPTSPADELVKLADLKDRGVITPEEFDRQKAVLLGSAPAATAAAGSAPAGSAPAGSAPAGSAPAGSAPAGSSDTPS
jgi:hypothetical protein